MKYLPRMCMLSAVLWVTALVFAHVRLNDPYAVLRVVPEHPAQLALAEGLFQAGLLATVGRWIVRRVWG